MLPGCHGDLKGEVGAKLHNLIYSRVRGGSRGLQGSFFLGGGVVLPFCLLERAGGGGAEEEVERTRKPSQALCPHSGEEAPLLCKEA